MRQARPYTGSDDAWHSALSFAMYKMIWYAVRSVFIG